MLIATSLRRKIVALLVAIVGFVVFYQATIFDSRFSTRQVERVAPDLAGESSQPPSTPASRPAAPGTPATSSPAPATSLVFSAPPPVPALRFAATAYCRGTTTASGVIPRSGIAAADEQLLPVGSVIQVALLGPRYDGIYTIMDTGPMVQGHNIDLYLWDCSEAVKFGRRAANVIVLRLGWNPRDTTPTLLERLLHWGEEATGKRSR